MTCPRGALSLVITALAMSSAAADVSPTGSYQTSIPIDVPALRGVQPTIGLGYDSSGGNGMAGLGWRLSAGSAIVRTGSAGGLPAYESSDHFLLDGNELVSCPTGTAAPSCRNGGNYVGRIDTFQRIIHDPKTNVWTVWERDGRELTFTPQLIAASGPDGTYRWALTRVRNPHGDTATYSYNCGGGDCVPTAIRWGRAEACGDQLPPDTSKGAPIYAGEALFYWMSRTDVDEHAIGNRLLSRPQRLATIEVRAAGRRLRAYRFDYVSSQRSGASLLQSVQEYGADAQLNPDGRVISGTPRPPMTFDVAAADHETAGWTPGTVDLPAGFDADLPPPTDDSYPFARTELPARGDGQMVLRWTAGDVTGDGITDYVLIGGIQVGLAEGHRDGTFEFYTEEFLNKGWRGSIGVDPRQNVHTFIADFDGDGRGDIMQALNNFYCDAECPCNGAGVCKQTAFRVARWRGDGHWDYYQHTTSWPHEDNITANLSFGWNISVGASLGIGNAGGSAGSSAGGNIASGTLWQSSDTYLNDNWFVGDYDGDGRADFMGVRRVDRPAAGGGTFKGVQLRAVRSLGTEVSSFETTTDTDWPWDLNHTRHSRFFVADADGDRKSDFMVVNLEPATPTAGPRVAFAVGRSDGSGSFTLSRQQTTLPWWDYDQWLIGDADGDGRADFYHVAQVQPNSSVTFPHAQVQTAFSDGAGGFRFGGALEIAQPWHFPSKCLAPQRDTPWLTGDVDGDGRTDLIHAFVANDYDCLAENRGGLKAVPVYSTPGGQWQLGTRSLTSAAPWWPDCGQETTMAMGDFNGDGRDDFLYGHSIPSTAHECLLQLWRLDVQPSPVTTTDKQNWSPADLNGDGREDLFYVRYERPGYRIYSLIQDANGHYVRNQADIAPSALLTGLDVPATVRWMPLDIGGLEHVPDGRADLVLVDEHPFPHTPEAYGQYDDTYDDHPADNPDGNRLRITTLISLGDGQFFARQQLIDTNVVLAQSTAPWRSADINGDGRGDLVRVTALEPGIRVDALVSRGDGNYDWHSHDLDLKEDWRDAANWRVIQLDGDGRSDLVYVHADGGAHTVVAALGDGDGRFRVKTSTFYFPFVDPASWRTLDWNGDGAGDLVYIEQRPFTGAVQLRLNGLIGNGDGTFSSRTADVAVNGGVSVPDLHHFRVADIDGDGRSDLVYVGLSRSGAVPRNTVVTLHNRHDGWSSLTELDLPYIFTEASQFRLLDTTADGDPELVYVASDLHVLHHDHPDERITRQHNGIGGEIAITYKSSAGAHDYMPGGQPVQVVDQVDISEGVVAGGVVSSERYTYAGARWSNAAHEFLGFATITRSDGRAVGITHYQQSEQCGARPSGHELRTASGLLFGSTSLSYVWPSTTGEAPYLCLPWIEDSYDCERSTKCRKSRVEHTYDVYGNETSRLEYGDYDNPDDDRLIESPVNVHISSTAYHIALPASHQVSERDGRGGWRLLSAQQFGYDYGAPTAPPDEIGDLTTVAAWDDTTSTWLESRIDVDRHGNAERVTGPATAHAPSGSWQSRTYECTFGNHVILECNALHCTETDWDLVQSVPLIELDQAGAPTTHSYDALGRLTSSTFADGSFTTVEPPAPAAWGTATQSVVTRVSDDSPRDGTISRTTFLDGLGRTVRTRLEDGTETELGYERASSRVLRQSMPRQSSDPLRWTTTAYDEIGRPISTTLPDFATMRTVYEPETTWSFDEMGGKSGQRVDGFGRIREVVEMLGVCPTATEECIGREVVTQYAYDGLDRVVQVVDAHGNSSKVSYDSLGGVRRSCDPDSGCWGYEYNADGTLFAQVDANGDRIELGYDEIGRRISKRYLDPSGNEVRTVSYGWDVDRNGTPAGFSAGREVWVEDRGGSVARQDLTTYDIVGRPISEQRCLDGTCMSWATEYDHGGRVRSLTYPDANGRLSFASERIDYEYDDSGRLVEVPGLIHEIGYDGAGRVRDMVLGNKVRVHHEIEPNRSWLKETTVTDGANNLLLSVGYDFDRKGRVREHRSENGASITTSYRYDSLDRLLHADSTDRAFEREFDYDDIGNLTMDGRYGKYQRTDPAHLHAVTGTDAGHYRSYDARGNLIKSERLELSWNADGMPTSIKVAPTRVEMTMGYDDDGQRLKRETAAGAHYYFSPLIEIDEQGRRIHTYVAGGNAIARRHDGKLAYLHEDLLGSVRTVTDDRGDVVNRYDYGAFGDAVRSQTLVANELQFGGAVHDEDSGLTYLNARFQDPELGVFISADTIVPQLYDPQSLNRYAFALNSPTNFADPSGHQAEQRVVRDIYGHEIGTMIMRGAGQVNELRTPGYKPGRKRDNTPDPTKEWASWQAPPSPPPLVEAINYDQILDAGRADTMRRVVIPTVAALGVGAVAGVTWEVAGPTELAMSYGIRAVPLLSSLEGLAGRAAGWYLANGGAAAMGLSGGINLATQGLSLYRDPEHWQFDSAGFIFDTAMAPIDAKVGSAIVGRYPMFMKDVKVNGVKVYEALNPTFKLFGAELPLPAPISTLAKQQGAFALYAAGMTTVRSFVNGAPLQKSLEKTAMRFPLNSGRFAVLDTVVFTNADLFPAPPGGKPRDLFRYQFISRTMAIAIGVMFPPPSRTTPSTQEVKP